MQIRAQARCNNQVQQSLQELGPALAADAQPANAEPSGKEWEKGTDLFIEAV
jgi:hypothetical protein